MALNRSESQYAYRPVRLHRQHVSKPDGRGDRPPLDGAGGFRPGEAASGGPAGDADRLFFASAGVAAPSGAAVSRETVDALKAIGIEHDGTAKQLSAEMIRKADVVFFMCRHHRDTAITLLQRAGDDPQMHEHKLLLLDPEGDIADPIGQSQSAYNQLIEKFTELIPRRLKDFFEHENRAGIGSSRG